MQKHKDLLLLVCIILVGSMYHAGFLHLNEVLRVADSFAYLQMAHSLREFSVAGLGSGWFGFVYSIPLALFGVIFENDFFAGQLANLALIAISSILLWLLARKFIPKEYSSLVIVLWYLSPTFLHFNIHVLAENIYIPLFLGLFLLVYQFIEHILGKADMSFLQKQVILIACMIGLMYLTRAEAFIYIGSIGLIALALLVKKYLSLKRFFLLGGIFFVSFFIFISPYLIHLHSLTGEWGLTNKGASNLRQAELRGIEHMDDAGFEQAVAELTPDKTQLIAGFAGGMEYQKPQIEGSLWAFIAKDPGAFSARVIQNWHKLFTLNIPEIFLGKSSELYHSDDTRFSHIFFWIFSLLPLGVLIFGLSALWKDQKIFFSSALAFFIPAFFFFTLFFTLNRYFLIFLPLMLITFVYGVYRSQKYLRYIFVVNIVLVYALSTLVYYNVEKDKDAYYALKKEAGEWLAQSPDFSEIDRKNIKIMERFPIVTYYAGSNARYITPYTDNMQDIYTYGTYNNLDILVVDTMDFYTYRPSLRKYLEETPENFYHIKTFTNAKNQKVILYGLKN